MRAFAAVFLRESVELAPATLFVVIFGAYKGHSNPFFIGLNPFGSISLLYAAVLPGVWHGAMDRLHARTPFSRHRPMSVTSLEGARWLAGATSVSLMFVSLVVTNWIAPRELPKSMQWVVMPKTASWAVVAWAYVQALLVWMTLRITVSWRGAIAPVACSILLPLALAILLVYAKPGFRFTALPILLLFSLYQGARFARVVRC